MLLQLIPALGNRLICDVITLVVGWCFQTDPTRDVINLVVGCCFQTGLWLPTQPQSTAVLGQDQIILLAPRDRDKRVRETYLRFSRGND